MVIDAGSGGGWVTQALLSKGVFVCAVDLSMKVLKGFGERFDSQRKGCYIVADLYHLPFRGKSFDAATSNDVYEHLEHLDSAACELRAVMKDNSRAFISVPYKENIVYYVCIHCNRLTPVNAHLHSFDEKSLGEIFSQNGFGPGKVIKFMNKGWRSCKSIGSAAGCHTGSGAQSMFSANTIIRKPGRMAMTFTAQEK